MQILPLCVSDPRFHGLLQTLLSVGSAAYTAATGKAFPFPLQGAAKAAHLPAAPASAAAAAPFPAT